MGECDSLFTHTRSGYILIENDNGIIINNPVKFTLSGGRSINPTLCSQREYDVTIDWLDSDGYDFFPSMQILHYYPKSGKLVFSDIDQVYAILYKDNVISDISDSMPGHLKDVDIDTTGDNTKHNTSTSNTKHNTCDLSDL
jgi:hypothetical protein